MKHSTTRLKRGLIHTSTQSLVQAILLSIFSRILKCSASMISRIAYWTTCSQNVPDNMTQRIHSVVRVLLPASAMLPLSVTAASCNILDLRIPLSLDIILMDDLRLCCNERPSPGCDRRCSGNDPDAINPDTEHARAKITPATAGKRRKHRIILGILSVALMSIESVLIHSAI